MAAFALVRQSPESLEEMNQSTHIQMLFGRQGEPASCFLQGTDRWVAKRALSGRRTD
jgi:hypothetical protein